MTFEASIPYSEYLARTRIEEERNRRAFTGEEPLEPEEMLDRQAAHVQGGGTVDDETLEKLRIRGRQADVFSVPIDAQSMRAIQRAWDQTIARWLHDVDFQTADIERGDWVLT